MAKRKRPRNAPVTPAAAAVAGGVQHEAVAGSGNLGRQLRFANWLPFARDADTEAQWNLPEERACSRDLVQTSPVATGAIGTRATSIIGTGLTLQARLHAFELGLTEQEAAEWQATTERRFHMWARRQWADVAVRQTFYQLQDLAIRSHDTSGDVFALLTSKPRPGWPFRLAVQMIEADRVCNPNGRADGPLENGNTLVNGVEMLPDGEPVRIHLAKFHPGSLPIAGSNSWQEIDFIGPNGRRQVLHLSKQQRPGQTRGRPLLAVIIATLKQVDRFSDAEVDAAVISASRALFATMDAAAFEAVFEKNEQDAYMALATSKERKLDSGVVTNLLPGESIISPTPGRPNPNFAPFFEAMLNIVSMGLGLPREVLAKQFNASYSASRAALLDAWRTWKIERAWFVDLFCQPIYEEWLADAVALNLIQAPGFFSDPFTREAWCGSNWAGDGIGSLNPLQEANAAEKRIEMGMTTLAEEIVAYDGGDWQEKHKQSVVEHQARVRDGLVDLTQQPAQPSPTPAMSVEEEDSAEDDAEDQGENAPEDDPQDATATIQL